MRSRLRVSPASEGSSASGVLAPSPSLPCDGFRSSLETALDEAARFLRDDPYAGVAAPVHHMRAQIESGLLSVAILEEDNG